MASSMLSGERRFLSARRGGMTVLGKVAVPKPVNLPSQRLENHGLDPKVEIVPKGTLSWGSRSSSSAPNAWGSPALSPPSTDGVTGSPSWLSGRPSSGGSGTRPSTAGSDRSHEPAASNTWGPNSRPSSASGVSALNNTSMATMRPSSAETRPGSSQLSRFAESIPEKSAAWGALGTAEQLRAASFNGFTLSSGDFPTLGSEKNTESHERQGHSSQGRPVSASGRLATLKDSPGTSLTEDEHIDANSEGGMVNAWKRESSSYVGDGPPPSMEKWQRDPHSFPNNNMPIQHLDPWHGIPVRHSSDGVWYRGPPGGPLYGAPGPPGSYPLEPFTYYHPQVPARPLANSQPVPRPGPVPPRGYHPKNGDSYRPQMPESYIRPIMPVRPGVYHGMVPYEGYYGPPCVGFCNSSERDAPVLGMAAGPCVYNGYPNHNLRPDSGNLHSMSGGYDSASTAMTKEQVEAGQSRGTQRGPYKVLLKQHDGWDEKEGEEKRDHDVTINAPHLERGHEPRTSMRENDRGTDHSTKDAADLPKTALSGISSSQSTDICEGSSIPVSVKIPEGMSSHKAVDDIVVKKPETPAISGGVPQLLSATKRNPTLIDKIQGLNTKARISDGRYDVGAVSSSNEKMKRFRVVNANVNHSINEAGGVAICAEKTYNEGMLNPSSHEVGTYTGSKSLDLAAPSGTAVSMSVCGSQASTGNMLSSEIEEKTRAQIHKSMLGVEGRVGDRGKGRFNIQEGEEWRKKPLVAKTSTVVPIANTETSDVNVQDFHASQEASERSNSNLQGKAGGEHATSTFDITNYDAQRATMREIAAQRAKQLQKEEEERIREQKAKANAKLEELNRRMLAESSTQKLDHAVPPSGSVQLKQDSTQKLDHAVPPSGSVQLKQEDSRSSAAPKPDTSNSIEMTCSALGRNSNTVAQMSEDSINRLGGSTILFGDIPIETLKCYPQDSVVSQNLSLPLRQNVDILEVTNGKTALQVEESIVSKQKQTDHKKKRNVPSSKNLSEMVISTGNTAGSRSHTNLVTNVSASSGEAILTGNPSTMDDPSPQQKKKTNRSGKGKHKLEEAFSGTPPLLVPNSSKPSAENVKPNASEAKLEVLTVHAQISRETGEVQDSQDVVPSADQGWSLPSEEAHDRVNNQWKPQPRRVPRNPLASRSAEKFHSSEAVVWAPVQLQNKNEASDEASRNTTLETNTSLTKKGHGVQSSWTKIKRAEMERYVPKPVAKEMSQQGNTVRPLSHSITHATSDEATRRAESGSPSTESSGPNGSATRITGSAVEPRNGESKNNKHGKAHGSGRQYGSTESPSPVQGLHEGSTFPSDPSKTALKSIVQHQPLKPEIHSLKGPAKFSDNRDTDNLVSTELVTGPVVKDHGTTGKGKRHPYKGHRGTGQSHKPVDHKDLHGGSDKNETQSLAFELSQPDGRNILRESHGVGEHSTSHWQPKSQPYVAHDRGQKVVAHPSRTSEKEFAPQGGGHLSSQNVKDTSASLDQLQSETPKTNLDEVPIVRHQVAKNEKKDVDSFKEREFSPNQGPLNPTEVAPANIDAQHGQVFSSRSQRHGQHHGRYGRLQELPHGGRTPAGQDSSKHYRLPANGDRRHNSHYEYQPVGSHNDNSSDSFERAAEGSRLMGSRYRERGQNHSRRGGGNFYGRNNGPV